MTPLATRLAKLLMAKPADRPGFWRFPTNIQNLTEALGTAQFFEVTQVVPLLPELKGVSEEWYEDRCFVPAKRAWIEWNHQLGRVALFVSPSQDGRFEVSAFWDKCAAFMGLISEQGDYEVIDQPGLIPDEWIAGYGKALFEVMLAFVHQFSVVINSPKIIDRREHAPHKGLQRRARDAAQPYEVRGWTELLLQMTATERGGSSDEAGLGGKKCLHFCRSFLRVRNGQLERVRDHWRGDAALGVKRKTYVVA